MKSCIFLFSLLVISLAVNQEKLNQKYKKSLQRLDDLPRQDKIATKEKENYLKDERNDKINRGFEKVIDFVNVLGQLDDFISDRAKNIIRKLHQLYNSDENDY